MARGFAMGFCCSSSQSKKVAYKISKTLLIRVIQAIKLLQNREIFEVLRNMCTSKSPNKRVAKFHVIRHVRSCDLYFRSVCSQCSPFAVWRRFPRTKSLQWKLLGWASLGAKTGCSTSEKEMFLERIMHRMRQRANERRVLVKPCFQDFDKYVTKHRLPPLRIFYIKGSFAGLRMPEGLWTRKLSYKLGIYRPALFK